MFGGFSILLPHAALPDLPRQDVRPLSFQESAPKKKVETKNIAKLAGLSCESFGGPSNEIAKEMVYWEDIESDSSFVSPFYREDSYLTFEADAGGWNNIRMAMETVLALAFAMGRTLVLPPEKEMYLLKKTSGKHGKQKTTFSFNHFFHMDAIHNEHVGLNIITMKEFLETVAMKGKLVDASGSPVYPPDRITDWDGRNDIDRLNEYLRKAGLMAFWNPEQCIGAFPSSKDPHDLLLLKEMEQTIMADQPKWETFKGNPVPMDAPAVDRLRENWAERKGLCIYNSTMQEAPVVHFAVDHSLHLRLLVHFYAFVFFQNWKIDLWMKRFIRDHVRYADEIQCAAARVVAAVRKRSKENGMFDAFHVRRGDFQYRATRVEASVLLEMAQRKIPEGSLLYMATDERNKAFFDPLKDHYDLVFLDDFHDDALIGVNTNYYGMIDQLVATRSRTFFGCWFSTYVNCLLTICGLSCPFLQFYWLHKPIARV